MTRSASADSARRPEHYSHDFRSLTGLRGIAALWVLSYHAWVAAKPRELLLDLPILGQIEYHPLFGCGWAGVQLFFTLSAFLLTLPYARHSLDHDTPRPDRRRFILRRFARVFPAYYCQAIILLGIALWAGAMSTDSLRVVPHLLTMNFLPEPLGYGMGNELNGVWWSLPIELSFYMVLPFIAPMATGAFRWLFFVGLIAITVCWRYAVMELAPSYTMVLWFSQLPGSLDSFAVGMLAACLYAKFENLCEADRSRVCRAGPIFVAISLVGIVALVYWLDYIYWLYRTQHLISYVWTPLLSIFYGTVIFFGAAGNSFLNLMLSNRISFSIGVISYGIYLWHLPITNWIDASGLFSSLPGYLFQQYWLLMFAASGVLAWISWRWIELPALRAVGKRFQERAP